MALNTHNGVIGARVRAARNSMGLALVDIVEQLAEPISIQQLALYENGKCRWPVDLLLDVAGILHVDIKTLCER